MNTGFNTGLDHAVTTTGQLTGPQAPIGVIGVSIVTGLNPSAHKAIAAGRQGAGI